MLGIAVDKQNFDGEKIVFRFYDWEDAFGQPIIGEQELILRLLKALGYWGKDEQLQILKRLECEVTK